MYSSQDTSFYKLCQYRAMLKSSKLVYYYFLKHVLFFFKTVELTSVLLS